MDRDTAARQYDSLLIEHDKKAREVSVLSAEFDLTNEQKKEIETLQKEMNEIQARANRLVQQYM